MPHPEALITSAPPKALLHWQLTKPRLSSVVVFSAVMGGLLAGMASWWQWVLLLVGGYGVTAAANIINQILERDTDRLMVRTRNRPLASGLLSIREASWALTAWLIVGLWALGMLGWQVLILGLVAFCLYGFVYTPLKWHGVIAVVVGAVPGALPPAIGYWAVRPVLEPMLVSIFAIQFFWQFAHFWVIAWLSKEDYQRAGYKLLPFSDERRNRIAIILATGVLVLAGFGVCALLGRAAGLWMVALSLVISGLAGWFGLRPDAFRGRVLLLSMTVYLLLSYMGLWLWLKD